jgi:quercetin dioxygenase-like cupin family protein
MMAEDRTARRARAPRRAPAQPVSVSGPVAFMHPEDVGKLHVPGGKRAGERLRPFYATQEDGVDTVKVLMVTDTILMFEAFRPKGAIDTAHLHPDHHSVAYQKAGRVRMRIGDEWFVVEPGDSYCHPIGIVHQHEALEDSVRIEVKTFPNGGAAAAWNRLVGRGGGESAE